VEKAAKISTSPTFSAKAQAALRRTAATGSHGTRYRANPKVFLFDEPLSNLDAKLRVQMRTEIKRVHQQV